jgi:hypothetical protein
MAACALVSARVRDGAVSRMHIENLPNNQISSEVYFAAARGALAKDLSENTSFDCLRACTLLALCGIQYGKLGIMQQYMGQFFTLAAMVRLYDEKHWPTGLTRVDLELRRRLYWCTYCLDVYAAAIWNCFLRSQEIHANIRYPVDFDEQSQFEFKSPSQNQHSWLVGWNFVTDLYRILEHVLNKARANRFQHEDRRSVNNLVFQDNFSDQHVLHTIMQMYYELPTAFKETPTMTGDVNRDIYGYQAVHIQASIQLVRIIIFSMEDGPGVDRTCEVANEVLAVFHNIPSEYLRAISTPLIYHLGSIGQVLASVIDEPLTESYYQRVRVSLISLAGLLDRLESGLQRAAGASQTLRRGLDKLDNAMAAKRPQSMGMPTQLSLSNSVLQTGLTQSQQANHNQGDILTSSGLSDFQLPAELFGEWPWLTDFGQS